jgi:hypothetical protein
MLRVKLVSARYLESLKGEDHDVESRAYEGSVWYVTNDYDADTCVSRTI